MSTRRRVYDLNPVDRITADAVGEPGQRVFYIQARQGHRVVTVLCEKEHVAALALAIDQFLLSLAGNDAEKVVEPDPVTQGDMGLDLPLQPVFRAGDASLGYDQVSGRLVVILYEQMPDDEEGEDEGAEEAEEAEEEDLPAVVRLWATPAQMRALSIHGQQVVAAGRPTCSMCGEPIEPGGHFCPRRNGDRRHD